MKIAFFTYPEAFQNIGGGEIQLLKTREFLERAGQEVRLFDLWRDRVEDFDILHIFSSVSDTLGLAKTARSRGVKVCVSPVLWSDWNRALRTDGPLRLKGELVLRHALKVIAPNYPSGRRKLLMSADLLFPNSEAERQQIARLFAVPLSRIKVVSNGVDEIFAQGEPGLYRERFGPERFILSVGRIEPRKNQLNLIQAVRRISGGKLHLIGSPVTGYEAYYDACRREGEGFTRFIPTLAHADPLLRSAYRACDLLVVPAWFETPGLAALEGALAGCRLALTSGGCTQEYFGDRAVYFDPASPDAMADAMRKALDRPQDPSLKAYVLERYSWAAVAQRYLQIYASLLHGKEGLQAPPRADIVKP